MLPCYLPLARGEEERRKTNEGQKREKILLVLVFHVAKIRPSTGISGMLRIRHHHKKQVVSLVLFCRLDFGSVEEEVM